MRGTGAGSMSGEERRKKIVEIIRNSDCPVSGTALAKELHVSRQIIVQDIALLRAADYEILSTTKGYILQLPKEESTVSRVLKVRHTDEQSRKELQIVVDLGGTVRDVYVQHRVYGTMRADLNIRSRKDIEKFMWDIENGKSSPLKNITSGYHFHTIVADSEETLDQIENELNENGFLLPGQQPL
jgi:hypothetical protein